MSIHTLQLHNHLAEFLLPDDFPFSIEVRLFSSAEGNGVQIKAARSLFSVWRSDRQTGIKVLRGDPLLLILSR